MRRQNRAGTLVGVLLGPVLVLGAMFLIWWNEGRINLADVAVEAAVVSAGEVDPRVDGQLIAVSGVLETTENLDDDLFLRPGPYVAALRTVEMFAWEEVTEEDSDGNSSLDYRQSWVEEPQPPEAFSEPSGHINPPLPFPSVTTTVPQASIGAYRLDPAAIRLPRYDRLPLSLSVVQETPYPLVNDYVFIGVGTLASPQLGDVRVSYWVVPADIAVTAIAGTDGGTLAPFDVRDKSTLFRVFKGDFEGAIQTLEREYQAALWGFRLLGFIMTWGGISLVLSPISRLFGLFPGLGRLSRKLVAGVSFVVAVPVAGVAIAVSFLAHNPLLLIASLVVVVGALVLWQRRRAQTAGA